jgi:hypothetical protein
VALWLALVVALGAPVALAARPAPEHLSDAYRALKAGKKTSVVRNDLLAAIADKSEPSAARASAQVALMALAIGTRKSATEHAENGAAVEHFTYALRAINAGRLTGKGSASDHLTEARALPHYKSFARTALNAIAHGKKQAAKTATNNGLRAAVNAR